MFTHIALVATVVSAIVVLIVLKMFPEMTEFLKDRKHEDVYRNRTCSNTDHVTIGISLGTAYSRVAVWVNGSFVVIPNEFGSRRTDSYVAFLNDHPRYRSPSNSTDLQPDIRYLSPLVGDLAKHRLVVHPSSVIFHPLRFLNRRHNDWKLRADAILYPFKFFEKKDSILLQVDAENIQKRLAPEEILAVIMRSLKESAERYLGVPVEDAVVVVPWSFRSTQRHTLKDVGILAGLNVRRIISYQSGVAAAYTMSAIKRGDKLTERYAIVFSVGAGVCAVSVVVLDQGTSDVMASLSNNTLGGDDLIHQLMHHLLREAKNQNFNSYSNAVFIQKLRHEVEFVLYKFGKEPNHPKVKINVEFGEYIFSSVITNEQFTNFSQDVFGPTVQYVKRVLIRAGVTKEEVTDVILAGGAAQNPVIRKILKTFFNGLEPVIGEGFPGEAKVIGAALQAGFLNCKKGIATVPVLEVSSYNVVARANQRDEVIISSLSRLPYTAKRIYKTAHKKQKNAHLEVFEAYGSSVSADDKVFDIVLWGLRKRRHSHNEIVVEYELSIDGTLNIDIKETGNKESYALQKTFNVATDRDMNKMMRHAQRLQTSGMLSRMKQDAREDLEKLVYSLNVCLSKLFKETHAVQKLTPEGQMLQKLVKTVIIRLDRTPDLDEDIYKQWTDEVKDMLVNQPRGIMSLFQSTCGWSIK